MQIRTEADQRTAEEDSTAKSTDGGSKSSLNMEIVGGMQWERFPAGSVIGCSFPWFGPRVFGQCCDVCGVCRSGDSSNPLNQFIASIGRCLAGFQCSYLLTPTELPAAVARQGTCFLSAILPDPAERMHNAQWPLRWVYGSAVGETANNLIHCQGIPAKMRWRT